MIGLLLDPFGQSLRNQHAGDNDHEFEDKQPRGILAAALAPPVPNCSEHPLSPPSNEDDIF
jgi:hypothetical protein